MANAGIGILEQSTGDKNLVGMGLSYRAARLHWLAESIPLKGFLGSLNVYKFGLWIIAVGFVYKWSARMKKERMKMVLQM